MVTLNDVYLEPITAFSLKNMFRTFYKPETLKDKVDLREETRAALLREDQTNPFFDPTQ